VNIRLRRAGTHSSAGDIRIREGLAGSAIRLGD